MARLVDGFAATPIVPLALAGTTTSDH